MVDTAAVSSRFPPPQINEGLKRKEVLLMSSHASGPQGNLPRCCCEWGEKRKDARQYYRGLIIRPSQLKKETEGDFTMGITGFLALFFSPFLSPKEVPKMHYFTLQSAPRHQRGADKTPPFSPFKRQEKVECASCF